MVTFADDCMLANYLCKDKQKVIDAVYRVSKEIVDKLGITTLNSVVIKDIEINETVFGTANFNGKITLSYGTAIHLIKNAEIHNDMAYRNSLSTIWHELYHVYDLESFFSTILIRSKKHNRDTIIDNFGVWTEFFATYKTYEICEDTRLYDSFASVFEHKTEADKKYYASRIFAYYLKDNHNRICDELIDKYLNTKNIHTLSDKYKYMLSIYPNITENDLLELNGAMDSVVNTKTDFNELKPIDMAELLRRIRNNE